jgi:uncharacterized membrane protein YgcG
MIRRGLAAWLLVILGSTAAAVPCHGRSITIDEFVARIRVEESAEVVVEESITLRFEGQWNGIHRHIPVVERTRQGFSHRLRLQVESVTAGDGGPLRHDTSWQGNSLDLKIFVSGASDAVRTVVIRYRLKNAIRFFEDHDELYWNVTGDEWPYAIRDAQATISLPGGLDNLRVNAFTGAYGSTDRDAEITVDGVAHEADLTVGPAAEAGATRPVDHDVVVRTTRPLGIRQGLTVAVAWDPGTLRRPTAAERWWRWLLDNLAIGGISLLPLAATAALFVRWRRLGRDPRPGPLVVAYEPPEGLGPAEVGTLIDNRPDMRDLMAAIVDLAVRGRIRIREQPKSVFSRRSYTFELLGAGRDRGALGPVDEQVLDGLFGDDGERTTVRTQDLEQAFYAQLPGIRSAIFNRLVSQGFYTQRPDVVRKAYIATGMGIVMLTAVAVGVLAGPCIMTFGVSPGTIVAAFVAGALTGLVVATFGFVMPTRTAKGAAAADAIRGFAEFLGRVDAHRLATLPLTPELFERYLPYAMSLGLESRWARAFADICKTPPQWYVGANPAAGFDPDLFASNMRAMTASTGAAMQSAPRTSDSSGFSGGGGGGGFSGGGSGGGGGRGF